MGRAAAIGLGILAAAVLAAPAGAAVTKLVSLSTAGVQGDATSQDGAISASGRFVVFYSGATNLVAGDTNAVGDIFVRDRDADRDGRFDEPGAVRTRRVSVSTAGVEANNYSNDVAISASGRFVAFSSDATNLVPVDTNAQSDVFVRDRDTDRDGRFDEPGAVRTTRVSLASGGAQADGYSATAYAQGISASGRFVVFDSDATNLVSGDTNGLSDTFVRDRDTDRDGRFDEPGAVRTRRLSLTSGGVQADADSRPRALSASGRFVVFDSDATNLVPGDTNIEKDAFVRDRDTDRDGRFDEPGAVRTTRVSLSSGGAQGGDSSFGRAVSASGRFVVFDSGATNLVAGDTNDRFDVFVRDRDTDRDGRFDEPGAVRTRRLSLTSAGAQVSAGGGAAGISASGRFVIFGSDADDLVPGDTNGEQDVFVRDRDTDRDGRFDEPGAVRTRRVSLKSGGGQVYARSFVDGLSANGRYALFASDAIDLVPGDTNAERDLFVRGPLPR